jgi:predicted dehydrogenase
MESQQPKEIRWGIIGPGKIAHKFVQDLAKVPNCRLIAVASRSQEKANEFAKEYQADYALNSYEGLAKHDQVDAIYIATPHSFHKEHSILCLEHGKAILCEKPFAMNDEEVEDMIAASKANNTLLMEALWTAFVPSFQYAMELIQQEKYGRILSLKADFGFFTPFNESSRVFDKKTGGGSLLDVGIYPIFAALSFLGKPERIDAEATFFENGTDSSCDIIFHYKEARAFLTSSLLEVTPVEAILQCEHATITIESRFHEPTNITVEENGTSKTIEFERPTFGYSYEIEHFNQLLRDGKKESDVMTFKRSRNLIKILDEVRNLINLEY